MPVAVFMSMFFSLMSFFAYSPTMTRFIAAGDSFISGFFSYTTVSAPAIPSAAFAVASRYTTIAAFAVISPAVFLSGS